MYDVTRLAMLRDLAAVGTLAAVADLHAVTASAVSQQMRRLEAETGVELLVRRGRRVTLTPAGQALAREAVAVIASLERAEGVVAALRADVVGDVTIGAYPSILGPVGSRLAMLLTEAHPRLRPRLAETRAAQAGPAVVAHRFDAALVLRYPEQDDGPDDGTEAHDLFEERFVAVVPAARRAEVERGGLAVLAHDPWILNAADLPCTRSVTAACSRAGFAPDCVHQGVGYQAAVQLVAAGLGVTVVPELSVPDPPAGVAVVASGVPNRWVSLIYRAGTESRPVTAAVIDAAERMRPVFRRAVLA